MQSTVAEFCLWKMFNVEIDSVVDKRGKVKKRKKEKKVCTGKNRNWEE